MKRPRFSTLIGTKSVTRRPYKVYIEVRATRSGLSVVLVSSSRPQMETIKYRIEVAGYRVEEYRDKFGYTRLRVHAKTYRDVGYIEKIVRDVLSSRPVLVPA